MVERDKEDKDENKDNKKEISEKDSDDNKREESEESEERCEHFEGFQDDGDFRIDLSGFSGQRKAGTIHSEEKFRNLELEVEDAPFSSHERRERKQGREREPREQELKQDLYSEAQIYNEQIKKYQDEITVDLSPRNRGVGRLERESIVNSKKAENLIAKPTELKHHEEMREDYIQYELKNVREEKENPFVPHEKKHREDARKYIAKGR